ncbi:Indole-3-glycerol phosphate synthase [Candidatus Kinetoplastibacterium sorsogonicusi]|uniref:Indole-3-glycerol phosphate synthase n=1 Tax=Candidatus Kinetoplastidibacterium kentomonadis TaxID=1576550 RepID=A0A3S7J930_9PROT|nr:indole-3-glycerol phosphate synthase TrpC [Candidatus Kinetoplastibacterium sorsogonicusi]AWD32184.1 Indole-3-glycerol phosphate synthase [Candidatus Kinetoplastibacterium sorsogonicusi]
MTDILHNIVNKKKERLAQNKLNCTIYDLKEEISNKKYDIRNFQNALINKINLKQPAIIAEIKQASPSKGILTNNFNPIQIAKSYEENGAACLSVLTEEHFFKGSKKFLTESKLACKIPVLRKDFIIDEYQIFEAKAIGADCILLIVSILDRYQLLDFENIATELDMNILVEVHNQKELDLAFQMKTNLIGINNRNLRSFSTDLNITLNLLKYIPNEKIIITESGISTKEDISLMMKNNVNAFLIGEFFMKHENPGNALKSLIR